MAQPTTEPHTVDVSRVAKPARTAERRIRLDRGLRFTVRALAASLLLVAAVLVLRKTGHASERIARGALALAGAGVVAAFLAGWTRPLARRAGAVALDKHHGLADRLSSALSFAELPEAERT
ncbi:MAG: hypothetical protein KC657_13460, partial [Myxococcales bacterium]|nr:hypothetical protein [Myxococcales bacterium]